MRAQVVIMKALGSTEQYVINVQGDELTTALKHYEVVER